MALNLTEKNYTQLSDGVYTDGKTKGLRLYRRKKQSFFQYRRTFLHHCYDIHIGQKTLSEARRLATQWNLLSGTEFLNEVVKPKARVPLELRAERQTNKTRIYRQVIEEFLSFKIAMKSWTSKRTISNGYSRIKNHVLPYIGTKPLNEITYDDIAKIQSGDWGNKKTVSVVINVVKDSLNWAIAKGWMTGPNPADPSGPLKFLIPHERHTRKKNQGTIPLERIAEFYQTLRQISNLSALCFQFSILTCVRSQTVRSACWEDIDLVQGIWTVDAQKLKIKGNGRLLVPLAPKVVEFLKALGPKPSGLVFHNKQGKMFSDNVFFTLIKRINVNVKSPFIDVEQTSIEGKTVRATQHGIARAGFKTWARNDMLGNDYKYEDKVSELCLHHKVTDNYGGAYERNSFWTRRCEMMQDWSNFVMQPAMPAELKDGRTYDEISRKYRLMDT